MHKKINNSLSKEELKSRNRRQEKSAKTLQDQVNKLRQQVTQQIDESREKDKVIHHLHSKLFLDSN